MSTALTAIQIRAEARRRLRLRRQSNQTAVAALRFRGAIARLMELLSLPDDAPRPHELMISGPAETGKTYGTLTFLDECMRLWPGAQATICRKVRADMDSSVLATWRRVIALRGDVTVYGGEKPVFYQYGNGSRVWVAGLDKPGSALSSERDLIYVNQAEELLLDDWQTLTTRVTGRGSVMPWTMLYGDCNPGPPTHWIVNRESLVRWESRHEDNPSLYDDAGRLTAQGVRSMAALDALTGVLKERLRYGRWVSSEGIVYELDRAVHCIDQMPPGWEHWRRVRAIDFGYTNPFVCLWGAIDGDGRIYIYRQIYMSERTVDEHARHIQRLERWFLENGEPNPERERISSSVADHDAEDRATLVANKIITVPANKAISVGIQAVQKRLAPAGDGRPRLFILNGSLVERDEQLAARHHPTCLEQEMEVYTWPKAASGKPIKEVPIDMFNHACDALRYMVRHVDRLGSGIIR